MKNALIDIGSNTIRLVIYDNLKEIENVADYAGLIADVKDGMISAGGIAKIICALTKMKKTSADFGCENIYAFATASLRDIQDKESLVEAIKQATGLQIDIISGEAEAEYDYGGLKAVNNIRDGAAFDLGGGSCQLMVFKNNSVEQSVSLPIGSLKLYTDLITNILPSADEVNKISSKVAKELGAIEKLSQCGFEEIFAMGGAVFALCALDKNYLGGNGTTLTKDSLTGIMTLSHDDILKLVPKRDKTVVPAAITMLEILKFSGAKRIVATPAGVRDGILHKNLLKFDTNE